MQNNQYITHLLLLVCMEFLHFHSDQSITSQNTSCIKKKIYVPIPEELRLAGSGYKQHFHLQYMSFNINEMIGHIA